MPEKFVIFNDKEVENISQKAARPEERKAVLSRLNSAALSLWEAYADTPPNQRTVPSQAKVLREAGLNPQYLEAPKNKFIKDFIRAWRENLTTSLPRQTLSKSGSEISDERDLALKQAQAYRRKLQEAQRTIGELKSENLELKKQLMASGNKVVKING